MNSARQSWLVASREIRERSRSRAFIASVVIMLVGAVGAIVLPALLDTAGGAKDVGLVGSTPAELADTIRTQGAAVGTATRIRDYDTVAAGEEAVRDGQIDVLVVDARTLEWFKRADEQLKAVVTGAIQLSAIRERAVAAGIDPDALLAMVAPVGVDNLELGQVTGRSADDETAAFIMTLVLFGAITAYGAMVLSGVVEEKSSRTVEVLLARMPARNLLAGKIAGIGLLGLAQIGAIALVVLVAGAVVDAVDVPAVRGGVLAWAVVWFVLGYALYATVFGVLGSLASRTEDASSVTGPVTVVLVLGFMVSFAAIGSAETTWARFVSWFPVTAPLAMPNRIAMGVATWWDPVVAVVITVAAIAGLVALGGRVYTHAILHTGATVKLRDAWRGAPAERRAPPTPAASADTSDRRTTTIVVGVAAAVGTAAFVLAHDVVIGIAVGAACGAVGRRLLRHQRHVHR